MGEICLQIEEKLYIEKILTLVRVCQNIRKSTNSFNGWSQRLAGMRDYIDF